MWRNSSGGGADREHHPFHHQGTKQRNQKEKTSVRAVELKLINFLKRTAAGKGGRKVERNPICPTFIMGFQYQRESVFLGSNMKSQMGLPLEPNLQTNSRFVERK